MTALEMKRSFLVLYDKITNFAAPGYDDEEISLFLTKAQDRVVLYDYNPNGNKYNEGFEETEQRRKNLGELVNGTTIISPSVSQTNTLPNGKFFDLPNDCLWAISEEVTISSSDSCINGNRISVKPITHDEYVINKKNPFKKPDSELVWRIDYNTRRHELITDGTYNITNYHLRYLIRPQPIITDTSVINGVTGPKDCQLNSMIHERIVDEAVKIATGITDPQYYQFKTQEASKSE